MPIIILYAYLKCSPVIHWLTPIASISANMYQLWQNGRQCAANQERIKETRKVWSSCRECELFKTAVAFNFKLLKVFMAKPNKELKWTGFPTVWPWTMLPGGFFRRAVDRGQVVAQCPGPGGLGSQALGIFVEKHVEISSHDRCAGRCVDFSATWPQLECIYLDCTITTIPPLQSCFHWFYSHIWNFLFWVVTSNKLTIKNFVSLFPTILA